MLPMFQKSQCFATLFSVSDPSGGRDCLERSAGPFWYERYRMERGEWWGAETTHAFVPAKSGAPIGRRPEMAAPLTVQVLRTGAVELPMARLLGTSAQTMRTAPILLIDLETEEGVTGHAYLFCSTPVGPGLIAMARWPASRTRCEANARSRWIFIFLCRNITVGLAPKASCAWRSAVSMWRARIHCPWPWDPDAIKRYHIA